ncbi:hypothetical protein ANO11243_032310 [Dothideomycetidae sp. 11243]|nr:hypothetical protein ANO11243_032310 [fungal sp. No.11243]
MPPATNHSDLYKDGINFAALAKADPDFAKVLHNGEIDFQNPKSLQQLTKSLLKRDFEIELRLPEDRLCPPPHFTPFTSSTPIKGLDIGTGASCIYPLLGTATHPSWSFHATDIDAHSLSFAEKNLSLNPSLSSRITLHKIPSQDYGLIPLKALHIPDLDFTMCNPPFYSSEEDMASAAALKSLPPLAVCTGSASEMIAPGGDTGFALKMLAESISLRGRVKWYTCMMGKLSSVYDIVAALKKASCSNWVVDVLRAGSRTRRWVVAWSWEPYRPAPELVRSPEIPQGLWCAPTLWTVEVDGRDKEWMQHRLGEVLDPLDVTWTWDGAGSCGVVEAKGATWSRSARRKKARTENDGDVTAVAGDNGHKIKDVAIAVRITARDGVLDLQWLKGDTPILFESLAGMLKRAMQLS